VTRWLAAVVLVLVGAVGAPGTLLAQSGAGAGEHTADELVARALRDNPELAALRAEVEAAQGRLRQAGLRPNPMVELNGQKALGPDHNLGIGVTLPLDLNGRKEGRVGVAEGELGMRHARLVEGERRLRAEVRARVGDLLAARRDVEVTDRLLEVNRDALRLVGERAARGAVPPLDESLLLVEVNRLEAQRRVLDSRVEVLTLALKALAALPPDAPLALRGDLASVAAAPARDWAVARVDERPDVVMARAEAATARARIAREEAEGRWDASVSLGYQRQEFGYSLSGIAANGTLQPIMDVFHYFGGGVTITLPVRNRNQGNVAAARAEARAAERRLDLARLMARQEVDAAFAQHEASRGALDVYGSGVRDVARRNVEVVRQAYALGRGTLLDVITEQRRYIEAEMGYTEALRRVFAAAVDVERAVGARPSAGGDR